MSSFMEFQSAGNVTIITPSRPRIDAAVAVQMREELLALIGQGHERLVFNLKNVQFIDSSGLGLVVSTMKAVGGLPHFAICHMHDSVMGVFRLTRMDKIFTIVTTEEDALARLAG
jgi:anti-sigma B factor antagonist